VQVVVLNRGRQSCGTELSTKLLKERQRGSEATTFVRLQRQVTAEKLGVADRQGRDRKRGDTVSDVIIGVSSLTTLKFGVEREHIKPGLGAVAKLAEGYAGVRQ
jgi:hypothetical protein